MKITLSESEIKKTLVNKGVRPHRVKFQLTNSCNARCKHCNLYLIKPDMLSRERVLNTIKEVVEMGGKDVDFTGGEPTLHPNLLEFIDTSTKLGLSVKMNSNGYLIDEKLAEKIVNAGVKEFAISIDSHDPDEHNQRRRLNDSWQRAISTINNIDKYRKIENSSLKIVLYSIITNKNYLDTLRVLDLKKIANFDEINFIPIKNDDNKQDFLNEDQIDDFYKNIRPQLLKKYEEYGLKGIFRTVNDPFEVLNSKREDNSTEGLYTKEIYKHIPCYICNFYAYIVSDGSVVPCCVAPHYLCERYIMGNINEKTFGEIWNSERYNYLRANLQKPNFNICECCSGHHTAFNIDVNAQIKAYERSIKKDH